MYQYAYAYALHSPDRSYEIYPSRAAPGSLLPPYNFLNFDGVFNIIFFRQERLRNLKSREWVPEFLSFRLSLKAL
jgi:hypothetical protein